MKDNRRVAMTKMLLKESLLELMGTKPISKITIKEICAGADLNRTTFYAHYSDQFALYAEIENDAISTTSAYLDKMSADKNRVRLLEEFFTYIKNNEKVFRILLRSTFDNSFKLRFLEVAVSHLSKYDYHELSDVDKDYIYRFIFMGALCLLERWIENDFDKSPLEIAELMVALIPSISMVNRKRQYVSAI